MKINKPLNINFKVYEEYKKIVEELAVQERRAVGDIERGLFERGLLLYLKDGLIFDESQPDPPKVLATFKRVMEKHSTYGGQKKGEKTSQK